MECTWSMFEEYITVCRDSILVSINTFLSSLASAQSSTKPATDVEGSHSSVETHNMQELIKGIHNNHDKYFHRDSEGKST